MRRHKRHSQRFHVCHGQKSLYRGWSTHQESLQWVYTIPDHPLLYGNNGTLDPGTCGFKKLVQMVQLLKVREPIDNESMKNCFFCFSDFGSKMNGIH